MVGGLTVFNLGIEEKRKKKTLFLFLDMISKLIKNKKNWLLYL